MPFLLCATLLLAATPQRLDPRVEAAIDLYQRGQFEAVHTRLLPLLASDVLELQSRAEARVVVAGSYLMLGDRSAARAQLVALARELPEYRVDPVRHLPELVELAEDARHEGLRMLLPEAPAPQPAEPPAEVREPSPQALLLASVFGLADPIGRSGAAGADAFVPVGPVEMGGRVVLGEHVAVSLASRVPLSVGQVTPHLGARLTAFPSLGTFGGGPVLGARVRLTDWMGVNAEVGAEYFLGSPDYAPLALTVSGGVVFMVPR